MLRTIVRGVAKLPALGIGFYYLRVGFGHLEVSCRLRHGSHRMILVIRFHIVRECYDCGPNKSVEPTAASFWVEMGLCFKGSVLDPSAAVAHFGR